MNGLPSPSKLALKCLFTAVSLNV